MGATDDDKLVTQGHLRRELQALMAGVAAEMARQANIIVEQVGSKIGVVDEKYQDVPPRVAALEERARDSSIHVRPAAPKRATKPAGKPRKR